MKKKPVNLDKIEGVIFDVDGVLADTGWVEHLKEFNISLTKQQYLKYAGKQGDVIESELIKEFNLPFKKNSLLSKKEATLIEWFHTKKLYPMKYAKQAVDFFSKRNIKLAAASGSTKKEAVLKLEKIGLLPSFHFVTGGNEVKKGKPFPDIYLHAAKLIKLEPSKCLSFEDTQYGVESAKSAGLFCFAVPTEFSTKQDFSKADGIFENLGEAIRYLNED